MNAMTDPCRILIIDDQPDNLVTLEAVLKIKFAACRVSSAGSGRAGLALAEGENPDVILLDIFMPGLDGIETCKSLKKSEATRHIPVLFLTASSGEAGLKARALDAGGEAFLSKPIEPVELVAQVNAMLRIRRAEDQLRANLKAKSDGLAESHDRYRGLFNIVSDAILFIDGEDGRVIEANESACRLYRLPYTSLLGLRDKELSAEPPPPGTAAPCVRSHTLRDGSTMVIEIRTTRVEWRGHEARIAALHEVKERSGQR